MSSPDALFQVPATSGINPMRKRERDELVAVLDSMLDGARQLAHLEPISIRRMGCDITAAVPLLGDLAWPGLNERIASASQRLQDGPDGSLGATAAGLVDDLTALRGLVLTTPVTYTVVFMPYNAAMWDSFHTIWQAADADPLVEAIVVPIPYADRLPGGAAGAWHVHTDQLPPQVPVTPYSEFDLQATHPDVIYVHNPYDGNNVVTSLEPSYYSQALRPHTGLLVYVPYYVSATPPGEHLYRSPSFDLFDKVIAQSEQIDQGVIQQWSSNRVVPLGSPKFDFVRTDGGPVPPAWGAVSAGRTTLLQLTSLSPLMNNPREVLTKLNEVLDLVEQSEDLALWWRPHPLELATVASVVPDIEPLYERYLDRAQSSDRVIVDTSMDLQRAIRRTDAYFGQWSSVVSLFGFTGKPIVIQDHNVKTDLPRPDGPQDQGPNADLTRFARPEWFVYEGAITYLRRMLDAGGGVVPGQREYFASLTAHADGSAGQHIHDYIISCLAE